MFKKFLNNLLGNDDEAGKQPEPKSQQHDEPAPDQHETEDDFDEEEEAENAYQYDLETQHGTHYTKADFDAAAEELYQQYLGREEDPMSQQDKNNMRREAYRNLYLHWNGNDFNQLMKFETANSLEISGFATGGFGHKIQEEGNDLYAPIHGTTLQDYAAIAYAMSQGNAAENILKAFGMEPAVWEEVNLLWPERMKEDPTFGIMVKYGEYFADAPKHPKLAGLAPVPAAGGNDYLDQLKTDRLFYEELCGARTAAYEYGLDGAQWIVANYGISLGDFQAVAMDWMTAQNQDFNSDKILYYTDYQEQKRKEYAEKFAAEQGGNVADDIEF